MSTLTPFHLAIPVTDLELNRTFYREILGCSEGRSSDQWVDFNFFCHQDKSINIFKKSKTKQLSHLIIKIICRQANFNNMKYDIMKTFKFNELFNYDQ